MRAWRAHELGRAEDVLRLEHVDDPTPGPGEVVVRVAACGLNFADDLVRAEDFVEIVKEHTGGRGADVIYDPVGGDTFDRSKKAIAWEGRILVIGFASGRIPEVAANHLLVKNYSVVGVHWGRYEVMAPALVDEVADDLFRLHQAGKIRPLVGRRVAMEDAPAALRSLADRGTVGKVVVCP